MNENSQLNAPVMPPRRRSWVYNSFLAIAVLIAVFALFYRLPEYPAPWYDEGSHLHVAKNFALNGIYADYSSEGIRAFGPAIGVGPTVLLPIALVFKLFGVSIPLARLVIVTYAFLALLAFYALASRFLNRTFTLIATVLLFISPGIEFIFNSRQVLGEVPGLFFLCIGLWMWLRPGKASVRWLLLVGVVMGCAVITKNQLALAILPAMFLNWIADLFWYKRRGWRYFVIPGIVAGLIFGSWLFILISLGQGGNFSENLATLREASAGAFLVLSQASLERAIHFLVDTSVFSAAFIPAFLYGLFLSLERNEEGQQNGMMMMFVVTGTIIFVLSLAWPRYAFETLSLTTILVTRLTYDVLSRLQFDWASLRAILRGEKPAGPAIILPVVVIWGLILVAFSFYIGFRNVFTQGNGAVYELGVWVDTNIPKDALIETWEPELAVLTNNQYHFPPQFVLAKAVAQQWESGPPASNFYNFLDYVNPDYVIIGPFDKFTDIYHVAGRIDNYEIIQSIGDYDIYKRKAIARP